MYMCVHGKHIDLDRDYTAKNNWVTTHCQLSNQGSPWRNR